MHYRERRFTLDFVMDDIWDLLATTESLGERDADADDAQLALGRRPNS